MKKTTVVLAFLLTLPLFGFAQQGLDTLSLESVFYEPLLAGNRPDFAGFSPDLKYIYYQANDSSMQDEELFRVKPNGKGMEEAPDNLQRRFTVSPNGKQLMYSSRGDIWIADLDFENKRKIIESKTPEYSASWGPSGNQVAYVQGGDVWIINLKNSKLTQVTSKKDDAPGYSIMEWAGPNKLVLMQWDTSDYEQYFFPEYVHDKVRSGSTRRGVASQIVSVANVDSGSVSEIHTQKGFQNASVSANGQYLALDQIDAPMKHRKINVYDLQNDNTATTVFEDSTDGWLAGTGMEFAPKGNLLMIQSEKDGWNHIYTINPDGSDFTQHTKGEFEVPWVEWTGQNTMVFASTEVDPGERHIYTLNTNNSSIKKLTSKTGYRQSFQLSRDNRHVVYEYTYFNEPFELYALDLKNPKNEVRLTNTIPDRFNKIDWQEEDYIRFTGRDGSTKLSMSVLEPTNKTSGSKHPVVVFVHGAGSLQNVYKGWSNSYYREYMFHQYLTTKGYYVMEVDYRHSTGYGRDFREDVTNWMGKYETNDIVDGINYLAEHYPQADTSAVGTYGGSYGGFMALYATSVEPDYFDAAAALRAVTNWENYYNTNPWYTLPRLGSPEADSAHYARSSPITYVDQLEQPVLILHGLIDSNVGFQDAAQYIDKLIQTGGKEFDMMMYPTERHSFSDPDAWYDEYSRIYEFFEEKLRESSDQ